MDPQYTHQTLKVIYKQRNTLSIICMLLMLMNFFLSLCLLSKQEKTIIVPATLQKEVEFLNTAMPVGYLEEMTMFFMTLLLDLTPQNIEYKSKHLLRYVEPSSYHVMENYFKQELEKHKKYNFSTSFALTEVKIIPEALEAEIKGVLTSKFLEHGTDLQHVRYRIAYKNAHGRLLITKFVRLWF